MTRDQIKNRAANRRLNEIASSMTALPGQRGKLTIAKQTAQKLAQRFGKPLPPCFTGATIPLDRNLQLARKTGGQYLIVGPAKLVIAARASV